MKSFVMSCVVFTALMLNTLLVSATTLGQVTVADPVLGTRTVVYEKVGEYAVAEGDILIGKFATIERKNAFIIAAVGGSRWPGGLVPFELSENLPLLTRLATLEAITLWQQKTNVKFVELNSQNRDQYPDYLSFVPAEGTTCSSFVGRQKGKQVVNLSSRCSMMITVHEIGHALGLWHEQSRLDRDNYVLILWENIAEDHQHNFNQHLTDGQDYGEYDYDSIMHYGAYHFSKNGKKTIIPLKDNVQIGQRDHLGEKDITAVNSMYPAGLDG